MSPVRTGAARTAALLAAVALLGTGCDTATEGKKDSGAQASPEATKSAERTKTVDPAAIDRQVCADSLKLIIARFAAVTEAAAANKPAEGTAKLEQAIATQFGALHTGLTQQAAKAQDPNVKSALQALDTEAAGWAAKPKTFLSVDQKRLQAITTRVDTVCQAK
jgi:hypothetical protein